MSAELLRIDARLVGNVTGKVYAENSTGTLSIFKEPEVYAGELLLAIPFQPSITEWPELDPADTAVILQLRTNSANTRLGREAEGDFFYIGHWTGWIERRPDAAIEIPNGTIV